MNRQPETLQYANAKRVKILTCDVRLDGGVTITVPSRRVTFGQVCRTVASASAPFPLSLLLLPVTIPARWCLEKRLGRRIGRGR